MIGSGALEFRTGVLPEKAVFSDHHGVDKGGLVVRPELVDFFYDAAMQVGHGRVRFGFR